MKKTVLTILLMLIILCSGCTNYTITPDVDTTDSEDINTSTFIEENKSEIEDAVYEIENTAPINDGIHVSTDSSDCILFEKKIDEIILQVKENAK